MMQCKQVLRRLGVFGVEAARMLQRSPRQIARLRGRSHAIEPAARSRTGGLSPRPSYDRRSHGMGFATSHVGWACLASRLLECSSDHLAKSPDCEDARTP